MPELIVIAVIALLVVGPKKLPELAKSLGKGLAEFRKVADNATDTLKETLKTEEIKKDMDNLKDSLLSDQGDAKGSPAPASSPDAAKPEESQNTAPKPQA
jgi:Tat protein translocase TatB subunit